MKRAKAKRVRVPRTPAPSLIEILVLAGKVDPGIRAPDELPALTWGERKSISSILYRLANEIGSKRPAHRPAKEDQDRKFRAVLTAVLDAADGAIDEDAAKAAAAIDFKLTTPQMKHAWSAHHEQAEQIVDGNFDRAALRALVKQWPGSK